MSPHAFLFDADALVTSDGLAYDGAKEMLDGLRSAGYQVGISLEGMPREEWEETETRLGLGPFANLEVEPERVVRIVTPGAADAALTDRTPIGVALWSGPDAADGGEGAEWRFQRPADITRTFAAWC